MGGSSEQTSTTTGWQPAMNAGQGIINGAGDIYNQMMGSNVPQLGNINSNANLDNAWAQMSGSGLNDLAGQLGSVGSQMMEGMGQLGSLYEQIGKGPNLYNQQNMRDTLLADKKDVLDAQNASTMEALNKAMADSSGQIYGAAAGGGNVGSSRTQLAQGQAAGNLSAQANAQMGNLMSQAYDSASAQAVGNESARLQALQAQASGIAGMGQMGASLMGQAGNVYQQSMNNLLQAGTGQMNMDQQNALINYTNAMNQYNQPMQLMSWYNSQVSPWVGASQTNTQSGGSNGIMSGIMGMGSSFLGSSAGSGLLAGMF